MKIFSTLYIVYLYSVSDAVKMQLVGSSVIDKILDLIQSSEKTADEDSLNTIRMATEIFPTLLHAGRCQHVSKMYAKLRIKLMWVFHHTTKAPD